MTTMRIIFIGLLFSLSIALPAAADSDGYFCVGPDYLAMEFRSFNTPGLAGPQVVKILHFDKDGGPRWAGEVIVEDFQPHRMLCQPQTVLLEGAGNGGRGWVYYTLALGETGGPGIASVRNDPAHVFVPSDGLPNLGNWARPGVIPLRIESLSRQFRLRITETSSREGREIRHDHRTVLEEMDDGGRVIRSLPITEGTSYESTGG
jgi:hypothetical protein